MPESRKTHIERIENEETGDFLDIEVIDEMIVEHGQGFDYQKTVFTFEKDSELRETSTKRIKWGGNNTNYTNYVDLKLIDKLTLERGQGGDYQKTVYEFVNDDAADRVVHVKTVSEILDVEVIDDLTVERPGPTYRKTIIKFDQKGPGGFDEDPFA